MYTQSQTDILKNISRIGIIPVIAIDDAAKAVSLAKALADGGLPAAEVTFRTAAAEDAIRAIAREVPDMLLGAGTVLTRDQVDRALDAGCAFLVSPGFNPELTAYAIGKGALMIPGTKTPGEMEQAMAIGLEVVKFFPAELSGGVSFLKAVAGPYKHLKWMCTGGINARNVSEYLSFDQITACGGTWMFQKGSENLIKTENWEEITRICKEAVRIMLGFEIRHIGIHCPNSGKTEHIAQRISELFSFDFQTGNFSGIACSLDAAKGKQGQITIATNSVERGVYQLERRGVKFVPETAVVKDGKLMDICIAESFGGFAVRLIQK